MVHPNAQPHADTDPHDHDHAHDDAHGHAQGHDHSAHGGPGLPRLLAALALAASAELLWLAAPEAAWLRWAGQAIAAAAIALAGFGTFRTGLRALSQGRLNIDALMSVAVAGAFVIGQWPEAAMVMALYAIAELIETRAVDRARLAIGGLMALAPDTAELRQADGHWRSVPVAEVPLGATVRVMPGSRVPLDGVLTEGHSSVDQAPVTGESLPVDKGPGDPVYAGTINQTGNIECRVTALAAQSTLARIVQAVEQAQASRAPTQRLVDRFAAVYTPAVFALALSVAIGGPLLFGWALGAAIYKALVLLVIACPCALVLSTPVTIASGLAAAARRGILVKGGAALERARLIRAVAFDKTGTLTAGQPRLIAWEPLDDGLPRPQVAQTAAALAAASDHPVARAIAAGLGADGTGPFGAEVRHLQVLPGRGIEADVHGVRHVLGNRRLIKECGLDSPELAARLQAHEAAGHTLSLLASDTQVLALFAVADTLRPGAAAAVAELKAMGITPVMLTGDHRLTAQAIGAELGLSELQAELLPDDKLGAIEALQQRHGPTAMVGDGINDAPALARADLGVAMGAAGTDIAMDTADIVVMNDELRCVAQTVRLSRRTHAVLWQNIVLALGIKAVFLGLAVFDDASMWMAVFADMGASLLVVFNGLRLLRPSAQASATARMPAESPTGR